jgi:hypothetical protein
MPKYIYFRNIYFGKDSLAKIFHDRDRIEDALDYNATAVSFLIDVADLLNQHALLTHIAYSTDHTIRPILMEWNKHTIAGRLNVLLDLGSEYDRGTKALLQQFANQLDNDDNYIKSLALYLAGIIASKKGLSRYYQQIYDRINYLKSIGIIEPAEKVRKLYEIYGR